MFESPTAEIVLDEYGNVVEAYSSREEALAAAQGTHVATTPILDPYEDFFGTPTQVVTVVSGDKAKPRTPVQVESSAVLSEQRGLRAAQTVVSRAVSLTREADVFRLAFAYDPSLVEKCKQLPAARFDSDTRTWTSPVCAQSVSNLRSWHLAGLTDVCVDDLLARGETPLPITPASLRRGTLRRPFLVALNMRDDRLFSRLRAVAGAQWEKNAGGLSYPSSAAAALAELVDRGVISDPDGVLSPAGVVVTFDSRIGTFSVRGDDRAAGVFEQNFPQRDVMATWVARGLDVAFADDLSAEVYKGRIAAAGQLEQPASITEPMFPHQIRNARVALSRSGFLVADEPGVGKTLPGIAVLAEDVASGASLRAVVVCPAAVRTHWRSEILRFTNLQPEQIAVALGDAKKRAAAYAAVSQGDATVLIVHYDVLNRDNELLKPIFAGATVVFDEAHRLKARDSQRSKAARTLCRGAQRKLLLTGTPVLNAPDEFYTLVDFAVPGALGSWGDFASRYMYPHPFAKGAYKGARNLAELRKRASVHFLRHTKAQVAEHLPPLRVQTLTLDADGPLAAALRRAHREARDEIAAAAAAKHGVVDGGELKLLAAEPEVHTGAEMTAVGALRMMCTSPRLLHRSDSSSAEAMTAVGMVPDVDGPKVDWVRETAAQMQSAGERLVVFTFFARAAQLLAERFTEDGTRFVLFTGSTSSADRDAAVQAFVTPATDEDPGPTVFLATDAAAEGLNLGKCCSTLVNLDLPWVPSTLVQRSQRIHRIDGTHERYRVINLVLAGTLEAGLLQLLERKADIAGAILGDVDARRAVTGRRGRSAFEEAMAAWSG